MAVQLRLPGLYRCHHRLIGEALLIGAEAPRNFMPRTTPLSQRITEAVRGYRPEPEVIVIDEDKTDLPPSTPVLVAMLESPPVTEWTAPVLASKVLDQPPPPPPPPAEEEGPALPILRIGRVGKGRKRPWEDLPTPPPVLTPEVYYDPDVDAEADTKNWLDQYVQ